MNTHKYKVNDIVTIQHDNHSFNVRIVGFENSSTAIGYCTKPIDDNHKLDHPRYKLNGTHWITEKCVISLVKPKNLLPKNLLPNDLFEV